MKDNGDFQTFEEMVEWLEKEATICEVASYYRGFNGKEQKELAIKYRTIALALCTLGCTDDYGQTI